MRGLRLQLLLLLGGLLVVTFLPLQLALATYTMVMLHRLDDSQARAVAGAVGAYVREAAPRHTPAELVSALERSGAAAGILGVIAHREGMPSSQLGDALTLEALGKASIGPEPHLLHDAEHRSLAFEISSPGSSTRLAINAEQASSRGGILIRAFGLYAFLMASSLLTLAYFALTRLIVRPLDRLSEAAQSVTLGSRQWLAPETHVRELAELGASLERMTQRLLMKEESLRGQIEEVERAKNELAQTERELVRSERLASVGRLAAGLAHEIGNPIAAMIGLADLVLDGGLEPEEQRDFIKRMRAETERVNRTLRDLLQFARPSREGAARAHAPGDVEAAIHDTAALVMHQASMRHLELCIDVHPGLPKVTLGSEQLIQVVLNLILNAADAMSDRSEGRVSVTATSSAEAVCIQVEDNGPGVPSEIAEHIFEPFFTTKEIGKGTGLGLSVCQGLVAAAGGSLGLDTGHTGGARFVVQLPLAERAAG